MAFLKNVVAVMRVIENSESGGSHETGQQPRMYLVGGATKNIATRPEGLLNASAYSAECP